MEAVNIANVDQKLMDSTSTKLADVDFSVFKYEGELRHVKGAKLLWKIKDDDGSYTERWMYHARNLEELIDGKRRILVGTDIHPSKNRSPDGSQSFAVEQYGEIVWMTITGVKV